MSFFTSSSRLLRSFFAASTSALASTLKLLSSNSPFSASITPFAAGRITPLSASLMGLKMFPTSCMELSLSVENCPSIVLLAFSIPS